MRKCPSSKRRYHGDGTGTTRDSNCCLFGLHCYIETATTPDSCLQEKEVSITKLSCLSLSMEEAAQGVRVRVSLF